MTPAEPATAPTGNEAKGGREPALDPRVRQWLLVALLLTLVAACQVSVLDGGFFWDDFPLIVDNQAVRNGQPLASWLVDPFWQAGAMLADSRGLYRPLTMLSYRLDWILHAANAAGFHATNLLVHLANAVLLVIVARRFGASILAAGLGAACWAALPRLTECTAWISGRTDMLALLCVLIAFALWPWDHAAGRSARKQVAAAVFAALALFCGLLCKEVAIAAVLGIGVAELRRWKSLDGPTRLRNAVVLAAALTPYAILRVVALGKTQSPAEVLNLPMRLLRVVAAAGTYAVMLADPFRPNAQIGSATKPDVAAVLIGSLFLIGLVILGKMVWRNGSASAVAAFAASVASLVMVMHVVPMPINVMAADRFLYLPTAFAMLAAVQLVGPLPAARRTPVAAAIGIASLVLAIASYRRIQQWNEPLRFWLDTCETADAGNYVPPGQLGVVLQEEGYFEDAALMHRRVLTLLNATGHHGSARWRTAETNLAETLAALGQYEQARQIWLRAVEETPTFAFGWQRLGRVEAWLEHWDSARQATQQAARLWPDNPKVGNQLDAIGVWQAIAQEMPEDSAADRDANLAFARARSLTLLGRLPEAEHLWKRLIETSQREPVLLEAYRFYAQDASPRQAAWALARIEKSPLTGEQRDALRLVLARRAESSARVEPLLPRVRAWVQRMPESS
ncbi:MAG: tetratricopeptide repeat protein [Deltaproteobacteria bacterium]|nr:tetratricopeptide repeat protein [Deltaproteobacteria bacterium]